MENKETKQNFQKFMKDYVIFYKKYYKNTVKKPNLENAKLLTDKSKDMLIKLDDLKKSINDFNGEEKQKNKLLNELNKLEIILNRSKIAYEMFKKFGTEEELKKVNSKK